MLLETSTDRAFHEATAGQPLPLFRTPYLILCVLCYVGCVLALWTLLRTLGDRWWFGTLLLLLPRWPWLLPLGVILPWCLWRRAWTLLAVSMFAAGVVLVPIMGFRVAVPGAGLDDGTTAIRLLSMNVHREKVRLDELARLIRETDPDLVALQDWTSRHDSLFEGLNAAGASWKVRREGELLVASRFEIGEVRVLPLASIGVGPKSDRGAAASFEIITDRGSFHLVNLHFTSPHGALLSFREDGGELLRLNMERRWEQSAAVRELVDTLGGPVMLAGDFNTTDDSPILAEHWSDFSNAFHRAGRGLGLTYLNRTTQIRIDHVLADRHWSVLAFRLGPSIGSPHRALIVDLGLTGGVDGGRAVTQVAEPRETPEAPEASEAPEAPETQETPEPAEADAAHGR
jgi:endonuclease/exonuclease/phosphatase (EEP) superfamily protein YafD